MSAFSIKLKVHADGRISVMDSEGEPPDGTYVITGGEEEGRATIQVAQRDSKGRFVARASHQHEEPAPEPAGKGKGKNLLSRR